MVTRTNIYTGVKYCNDPTILAWETGEFLLQSMHERRADPPPFLGAGNELGAYLGAEGYPPLAWTKNIASYIKSLAPSQLVIDGSDGFLSGSGAIAPGVNVDAVDIMTDHAYPRNIALVNSEITIAKTYNKNFLIGGKLAGLRRRGIGADLSRLIEQSGTGARRAVEIRSLLTSPS